jgi:chromosome segregation ATPase
MSEEADDRLRRMIGSLRGERPAPEAEPVSAVPAETAPDAGALEDYRRRIQDLETRLAGEAARNQAEAERRESVESQIRQITDMLREEKRRAEIEQDKAHAQGRVESLEKRLDDLQEKLLGLIQQSIDARSAETDATRSAAERVENQVAGLGKALDVRLKRLEETIPPLIEKSLAETTPEFHKTIEEALRERLEKSNAELLAAYQKSLDEALMAMRSMMLKTLDAILDAEKARDIEAENRTKRVETRAAAIEKEFREFFNREPGL